MINAAIENFLSLKSKNTEKSYRISWKQWEEFLKSRALKPTKETALLYVKELNDRYSPLSVNQKINALHSIFSILVGLDILKVNPFEIARRLFQSKPKQPINPHKSIDFDRVHDILAACDGARSKRDRAIIALLFGTGMRRSEVASLNCGDVRASDNGYPYVYIKTSKTGGNIAQPLPIWAWEHMTVHLLKRHQEGATNDSPLFEGWPGSRIDDRTVCRIVQRTAARVGIKMSAHDARATVATLLKAQNVEDRDVASVLRHKTEKMVRAYDRRSNVAELLTNKIKYN